MKVILNYFISRTLLDSIMLPSFLIRTTCPKADTMFPFFQATCSMKIISSFQNPERVSKVCSLKNYFVFSTKLQIYHEKNLVSQYKCITFLPSHDLVEHDYKNVIG